MFKKGSCPWDPRMLASFFSYFSFTGGVALWKSCLNARRCLGSLTLREAIKPWNPSLNFPWLPAFLKAKASFGIFLPFWMNFWPFRVSYFSCHIIEPFHQDCRVKADCQNWTCVQFFYSYPVFTGEGCISSHSYNSPLVSSSIKWG